MGDKNQRFLGIGLLVVFGFSLLFFLLVKCDLNGVFERSKEWHAKQRLFYAGLALKKSIGADGVDNIVEVASSLEEFGEYHLKSGNTGTSSTGDLIFLTEPSDDRNSRELILIHVYSSSADTLHLMILTPDLTAIEYRVSRKNFERWLDSDNPKIGELGNAAGEN